MKKQRLFPIFLLSSLFILGSCANNGSSSEPSSNPDELVTSVDNTIGDAYEGDSRPNFGEKFDYDSDYIPQEPDDPNYKVVVTLSSQSPLLFANGTKAMEVKPNYLFKEEDFDLNSVSSDRKLDGMALFYNEGNEYKGNFVFGELRAPKQNATLRPFFSQKEGYTALDIGSGANSKFNFDKVPGTITANKTIQYNSGVLVDGGKMVIQKKGSAL